MNVLKSLTIVFLSLIFLTAPLPVPAQTQEITVRVDGLSCPFCAYGLEKKLKRLEGTEDVTIQVNEGKAVLRVKKGKTPAREDIEKAVRDAGFTPREITFSP